MSKSLRRIAVNGLNRTFPVYRKKAINTEEENKFEDFADNAHEILIRVKGVWPFDMFPDEAKLDRQMFTVKRNVFFGVSRTITSHHDDILNSHLNLGPVFGSVTVHLKYVTNSEETITWLTRKDAKDLHTLLQGLLSATKNGIDLTKLEKDELVEKLKEMGDTV